MNEYFFKVPFASNGDRADIPRGTQSGGEVSYTQGWGPDYQKNLKTQATAKAVSRQATNQMMFALTQAVGQYQMHGVPGFITAADNDGTPFAYGLGAQVLLDGVLYVSLQANNTTTPGTGNLWQTVLFRVATDAEVREGKDSRTFIVPSNLKAELDVRDTTINESIKALSQTVDKNKQEAAQSDNNLSQTITQNKQAQDQVNRTFNQWLTAIDLRTINGHQFTGNITLNADDVGAVPKTGTNQIIGNLQAAPGSDVQFLPTNYGNFDQRYTGSLQGGGNGYFRDKMTGFTIVWGIVDLPAINGGTRVNFHQGFTGCYSVTGNPFGSLPGESTKNLVIADIDASGFTVWHGSNEIRMCYQAMGFVA